MLSDLRTERYYRDLFSWADRAGLLRAAYLRVDSMPWAFATVLRQPPAIYLMKIAYHEGHREHAPGVHLTREILRAAVEDPEIERVELLGEPEAQQAQLRRRHPRPAAASAVPRSARRPRLPSGRHRPGRHDRDRSGASAGCHPAGAGERSGPAEQAPAAAAATFRRREAGVERVEAGVERVGSNLHTVTVSIRGLGPVRVTTPPPAGVGRGLARRDEGASRRPSCRSGWTA